jgi:hypothetical protein
MHLPTFEKKLRSRQKQAAERRHDKGRASEEAEPA